jgi:tetratricopeptide (TPR) repeat protein
MLASTRPSVVILIAAILFGCASSPQARRDRSLSRGKQLIEKKDYPRALLELKNAARAMPQDAEVYYQMGLAYLGARDLLSAYSALRKAVALNPKHSAAQLRLAQVQTSSNDPELLKDAQGRLRSLIGGGAPTADMLNTLAFTELKLGNPQDAIDQFQKALVMAPGELFAAVMLARAKLSVHDVQGAEAALQKACAEMPKSADARKYLGEFYVRLNRLADADKAFRDALTIEPKNGATLLDLGLLEIAQGRKDEAEKHFKQLIEIEQYQSTYGIFLYQSGRGDEAIREFERLVKENPDNRQMRTNLIIAYRTTDHAATAEKVLQQALEKNPNDAEALLQRAELAIENRQFDQAEVGISQLLKLRPTSPEAHYVKARLEFVRGMLLTYRQELSEALRLNPDLMSVRVELAQHLIGSRQPQAALNELDAAPAYQRSALAIIVQRNWALWGLGQLAEMRKGIDQGLAIRNNPDLLVQDGIWKLRAGNPAGARTSLEQALAMDPTDARALAGIQQSYIAQRSAPMALQKVRELAAQYPKSEAIQSFLGTMLVASGDNRGARVAFEAARTAGPNSTNPDLLLVQLDLAERKYEDARTRLEQILSRNSSNRLARLWLGNVEMTLGRYDLALQNFQKIVAEDPGDAQAQNNLAYLLVDKQPNEALKYAQRAVELAPDRPAYCDTLGWVLYRKGLYSSAVTYLERAAKDNSDPVWAYHLAMAYAKSGDVTRGRRTLQAALKQNPNLPEANLAQEIVGRGN